MPAPSTSSTERVDTQFMFSNHKNVHKPGIEKRQRKLLQKIPFINSFLAPDEKILRISTCVSPTSIVEQLTMGWIFAYVHRALLVVTDKGVFHIPTKRDYSYRHSIARFRYEDCKRLESGWNFFAQYGNGKKERFLYVPRENRKKLKPYFQGLTMNPNVKPNAGKTALCPRCTKPLSADVYQCPSCRLAFKDMATATKLSILIPGGGYFYTGHFFLGIGDFVVELFLLMLVVMGIVGMMEGNPQAGFTVIFFGVILAIEKLITIHHAKRYISEYIPKEKTVPLQPVTA